MPHRDQPTIDAYAPVRAHCDGEPVHAFGFTYVYAVSPDFDPGRSLQAGNTRPWTRLRPRKSWEIGRGKIGSTPAREPRTAASDHQPYLCVHLIDGDPETMWCSQGRPHPNAQDVWIRIDLAVESRIGAVRLVPHPRGWRVHNPTLLGWEDMEPRLGQALPEELVVRVSTDALHWETVHEGPTPPAQSAAEPRQIRFAPRPVKQVVVTGRSLPPVLNLGYCMSISSVEVQDEAGDDLALVCRGAGVTVSSTNTGYGMDRYTQEMLWPIQFDVGYKWARVGYDFGMFYWPYVEREKGVLAVDPRADAAITESVDRGIDIVMCLDKGNWLYAPQPKEKDPNREPMDTYYDRPPEPTVSAEAMAGWLRYVRFMVHHFRDRVRYFEVMNEWYDLVGTPAEYMALLRETVPVIRDEYPEARIVMASASNPNWGDFILPCLELGAGPLVDVIGWHGLGTPEEMAVGNFSAARDGLQSADAVTFRPHSELDRDGIEVGIRTFADKFADLKEMCRRHGFEGEYLMSEFALASSYPPVHVEGGKPSAALTELQKATYAVQALIECAALDISCLWNETFQTQVNPAISLLRNTFAADPLSPTQPEIIYYAQRTLCTVLGDTRPADLPVAAAAASRPLRICCFRADAGHRLAALWAVKERLADPAPRLEVDVTVGLPGTDQVVGIDLLNGRCQELEVRPGGEGIVVPSLTVTDFPIMLRF